MPRRAGRPEQALTGENAMLDGKAHEIGIRVTPRSWRRGRLLIRWNARQVAVKSNSSVDGGCVVSSG